MRIGIDCRTILNPNGGEKAGVGHYTSGLVRALIKIGKQHEFVLFFHDRTADIFSFEGANVRHVFMPLGRARRYLPYIYSHILTSVAFQEEQLDVLHVPATNLPLHYPGASVVTVHDLAIYPHPEWFPSGQAFSTRICVPRSLKRASRIIAVSKATKKDAIELFNISPDKIRVIPEGIEPPQQITERDIDAVKQKFHIPGRYIFFIGTIEPRKNLARLIKAFDALDDPGLTLVIAGAKGWKYEESMRAMGEAAKSSQIRYVGYVRPKEKWALYSSASCFAFPSLYEGFGLPVLEARAAGIPVVTSNVSSLPEVAGPHIVGFRNFR